MEDVEVVTVEEEGWLNLVVGVAVVLAGVWWWWSAKSEEKRRQEEAKKRAELRKKMHIPHKDDWRVAELAQYTGGPEEDPSPIVFAVKDTVFNVWRGRDFYGCEGAYHCFAGKDATIMMALELLDPPTEFQNERALTRSELATLEDWFATFAWKYEKIGTLAPGEGIWEREPVKRRNWDAKVALFAPSAIAAAAVIASTNVVRHAPPLQGVDDEGKK